MTEEAETVKTAQDLELEKLRAEVDSLRAQYTEQVKTLIEANKGLWSALHPAKEVEPEGITIVAQKVDDMAQKAFESFNTSLGIDSEEN